MKRISLICTVHEECGVASASALYAILTNLRPDVIFFEAPVNALDDFIISGTRSNLESISIRRYRESFAIDVVPVDLPTPEAKFFRREREFHQSIEGKSTDFRRLMIWNTNYIRYYGFPYLNSKYSEKMWADIYSDVRATVKIINNKETTEFFDLWNAINDLRENEMMRNILKYCEKHSFERAVFMIGAAHRNSIIEKAMDMFHVPDLEVQWSFTYYEDHIPGRST